MWCFLMRVMLSQLSTSPARSAVINTLEGLRRTSPSLVRQFLPVLDQLEPIFASLADGTQQFVPHPSETSEQLRTQYGAHWCRAPWVGSAHPAALSHVC